MVRRNYGPTAKLRAARTLEALLAFSNDELNSGSSLSSKVHSKWKGNKQLVIRAEVRFLEILTALAGYSYTGDQIKEALKHFEDFIEILEDNRLSAQGAKVWHFTLTIWYDRWDVEKNLERFEQEWDRRRALKKRASASSTEEISESSYQDWGEALDIEVLHGRTSEQANLKDWIVQDRCRLIMLLGMGGIGKTTLAIQIAEQIQDEFDYVIWRSLRNARPLTDLLIDLISVLSDQQAIDLSRDVEALILQLLQHLRGSRCLLVLDNFESLLQSNDRAGNYRETYEGYGQLLRTLGETKHQSCLVITSREQPSSLVERHSKNSLIRWLPLDALSLASCQAILKEKELVVSSQEAQCLANQYAGNPLALKIAATTIQDLFDGDITQFLTEGTPLFGDIADLLRQQMERLSAAEKQIMYWLAINREETSLSELKGDLWPMVSLQVLQDAITSLQRRSLIEKKYAKFTQQPVVMEYMIAQLIQGMCTDIETGKLTLLSSHALSKALSKDYMRAAQKELILKPLVNRLLGLFGGAEKSIQQLIELLSALRSQSSRQPSYGAGNVLKLLNQLNCDLSTVDCSKLVLWQVYLPELALQGVNLTGADLSRAVFNQTTGGVLSAALSPEGEYLATGIGQEIVLWQLADNRQLFRLQGHEGWVVALAFSPDGEIVASGSRDGSVRLWKVQTGQCIKTLRGHTHWVQTVAFALGQNADDSRLCLASGSYDHTIRLWDAQTGELLDELTGHTDRVTAVAFGADGNTLVSSSGDCSVRVWDIETKECLRRLEIETNWVLAMALSPDGVTLAVGCDRNSVQLWDIQTGNRLGELANYTSEVWSVDFSPDGRLLATGSEDNTIKLWDVCTRECVRTFQAHGHRVWLAAFCQNGDALVSCSDDQTIKLWDIVTGNCLSTLQTYRNTVPSVAVSPDGLTVASGYEDSCIRLWDLETGECAKTLKSHTHLVGAVAFDANERYLVSGSDDQTLKLWDMRTGECVRTFWGHQDWITSVAFHPEDDLLASGSHDGTVKLWEVRSGECLHSLAEHTGRVKAVAFSLDGKQVASAGEDQMIKLWDVGSGQCLQTLAGHEGGVLAIALSSDGEQMASGGGDETIRLWNRSTGKCTQILKGHKGQVRSVAFSDDGQWLASGGSDQTVRLWELQKYECVRTLEGHTQMVWEVAFAKSSQVLISSSDDGSLRQWDIESENCQRCLIPPRPYEGMNIVDAVGLTMPQILTLKALGAVEID